MNFVIGLSFNKYKNIVYDAILVMINRYIKMIKYLPMFITIDAAALAELFFAEIVYRYDMSYNIINDRGSVFTSVF